MTRHPQASRNRAAVARADAAAVLLRWLFLATLTAALLAAAAAHARPAPDSFADLADKLLPAVVNVSTTQKADKDSTTGGNGGGDEDLDQFFKDFFDKQNRPAQPRRAMSLGSGFIIDAAGYIVTNNHVIADAEEIKVRLHDDTELKATVVGRDEKTDLALLKVESKTPLPALKWGDSDQARIGDWVLAIGNPFGLGGSVTAGILSARQRDINAGPYDDFLQTDASINRGNSGGPMFNVDGEVIGINTAIFSPSGGSVGIGFAIPSNLARNVIDQLRQYGHPRRGWLGVRIQSVTDELAEGLHLANTHGALVANVTDGGPAAKAGIQQGDVVIRFDGRTVDEMRKLPRMVAETPIEKQVDVVVWRKGKEMSFKVTLGELDETETAAAAPAEEAPKPAAKPKSSKVELLGMTLSEITAALRKQYELGDDASGVVVTEVKADSAAAEKGMAAGDLIVEVDQKSVGKPEEIDKQVKDAKTNGYRVVTLLVFRQGDYRWVALRIDQG
ncbi:MAG: DegQ family serine endoprotease [Dongiaceae bacterium]